MTVKTGKVTNRRSLRFQTLEDLEHEAHTLATSAVVQLGNWSLGQIMRHLSISITGSIDGYHYRAPWPMRIMAKFFFKNAFIHKSIPAGFQVPNGAANMSPAETTTPEGLKLLLAAIGRLKNETKRESHPFLGTLTRDEWNQLHLRHSELHLSFAIPTMTVAT